MIYTSRATVYNRVPIRVTMYRETLKLSSVTVADVPITELLSQVQLREIETMVRQEIENEM